MDFLIGLVVKLPDQHQKILHGQEAHATLSVEVAVNKDLLDTPYRQCSMAVAEARPSKKYCGINHGVACNTLYIG